MKFVISWLLCASAYASPIRIFYEDMPSRAQTVKDIFINEYQIPEDLITLKLTAHCEGLKEKGKLDLCLKNNGDLLIVSVDRGFVTESLKIFHTP